MDEILFIEAAKLKTDRQTVKREHPSIAPAGSACRRRLDQAAEQPDPDSMGYPATRQAEGTVMRTVLGLVLSLVINGAALGTLEWTAQQAQEPPTGEVSVVQLFDSPQSPAYAQLALNGTD